MVVALYILCVIAIVGLFILFVIMDRIKDINDDLQLIRMRAFRPKEENTVETCDVASLHPISIAPSDVIFGGKYSFKFTEELNKIKKEKPDEFYEKMLDAIDKQEVKIRELQKKLDYFEQTLNDHENKLNEIYIEE